MKQNSKRLTSIIIAMSFLAVAVLVYLEFILPAYSNLETDKAQALSEATLYSNESQIVTEVKALIATYQSESSSTEAVNMALPVGQNVAGALAQVYGIAANTGFTLSGTSVTVQTIQSQPTQAVVSASSTSITTASGGGSIVKPVGTITFQFAGSGSYESMKSFLMGLEDNIRIFDITGIAIQPTSAAAVKGVTPNPDLFNYTISAITYYQSS